MIHRNNAAASIKRVAVALVAAVLMTVGSPFLATSSADQNQSVGANKQVTSTHGDCKHTDPISGFATNDGVHHGYACPTESIFIPV